jgi:hypothetical protein
VLAKSRASASGRLAGRMARLGKCVGLAFILLDAAAGVVALIRLRDSTVGSRIVSVTRRHLAAVIAATIIFIPGFLAYLIGIPVGLISLDRQVFVTAQ